MTVFQVGEILCHARNEDGELISPESDDDGKEDHRRIWRERGLNEDEIEHKYDEELGVHLYREQLAREGCKDIPKRVAEYRAKIIKDRKWGR